MQLVGFLNQAQQAAATIFKSLQKAKYAQILTFENPIFGVEFCNPLSKRLKAENENKNKKKKFLAKL